MKKNLSLSADQVSEAYAKMQMNMISRSRARKGIALFCILLLSAFLLLLGSLFFILPEKAFSEKENRMLTSKSVLSARGVFFDGLPEKLSALISDQFPMRDAFVGIESYLSLAFTGKANNVKLRDGSLSKEILPDAKALDNLDSSLDAVKTVKSLLDIESHFLCVPLPCRAYQNRRGNDTKYASLEDKLTNADCFDFARSVENKDGIFYKTDHHLNADGTYLLYLFLCKQLNVEPKTDFKQICVSRDFYGTAWSQSGLWDFGADSIYVHAYEGDNTYKLSGDIESDSMYFPDKLKTKDKYAYFLGGNYGYLEIKSVNEEKRQSLLIIKDSYANSLVPLLARHFDITLIDPRYFNGDVLEVAKNCSKCLFLFGVSSLMTDVGLVELSFNAGNGRQ